MHLKRRKLSLPSSGLVLEVGGGGSPHTRSDVLVDRFLDNEEGFAQRGRVPLVVGDRVMIQADGALMPFRDIQFKYVILSHVIEHIPVESIHQFVGELQRVASSGYIEAPSILYEAIRDIPEHIWYVLCEPGVIHLAKKTSVSRWQPFINPLFDDVAFRSVVESYADLFFTGMEWQDSLKIQIHKDVEELMFIYPPDWARMIVADGMERTIQVSRWAQSKNAVKSLLPPKAVDVGRKIRQSVRQRLATLEKKRTVLDWCDLVVCPICHSSLKIDITDRRMKCIGCNREYAIRADGIPSFI